MEEENKQDIVAEPTFLDQVKAEREALEKIRDENKKLVDEMKNLKAVDIMSGRADQNQQAKPAEISAKEYAELAIKGRLPLR